MSAVWEKLFGNGQLPANDASRPARRGDDAANGQTPASLDVAETGEIMVPPEAAGPAVNSVAVARTFDSIGRRNEALRSQLDSIEFAFRNIESIRARFHEALPPIDEILVEIERTKTDHLEVEKKLEAVSAQHNKLRGDHAILVVERDALAIKHDDLTAQVSTLSQAGGATETLLSEARAAVGERNGKIERLERELEDSKKRMQVVSEQLPSLRAEFNMKEKRLQEVDRLCASLQDQLNLMTQENRALRSRVEELVASGSRLNRQLSEIEGRHQDATRRIGELETGLHQESAAHAQLKSAHLDAVEAHNLSFANLQESLNSTTARSEAAERLLAEARNDLRERNSAIRSLEQQALEGALTLEAREKALAESEKAMSAMREQLSEVEAARASLMERSADLVRALETRDAALLRSEQKIEVLDARIADITKTEAAERLQRDEKISALIEQLDAQSAARAFAEGALQSARQERALRQRDGESAGAAKEAAPSEPGREKVARLRG